MLDSALQVARRFRGHVEALHVRFDPRDFPLVTGYGVVSDLVALTERLQQTADRMAEQARRNFEVWRDANHVPVAEKRDGADDVSVRWLEIEGPEAEIMVRRGRLADLIVVARPVPESGCASQVALEAALFDTSRPVLMVPEAFRGDLGRPTHRRLEWQRRGVSGGRPSHAIPGRGTARRRSKRSTGARPRS